MILAVPGCSNYFAGGGVFNIARITPFLPNVKHIGNRPQKGKKQYIFLYVYKYSFIFKIIQ